MVQTPEPGGMSTAGYGHRRVSVSRATNVTNQLLPDYTIPIQKVSLSIWLGKEVITL